MKLVYRIVMACLIACALCSVALSQGVEATPHPTPPDVRATPVPSPLPEEGAPRLSGMTIGLDPGHQARANREQEPVSPGSSETKAKVSSGTQGVSTRINEYETNLTIALMLRDRLEDEGARVVMTRQTHDVDISNVERAKLMNDAGVDIWLRIHCNGNSSRDVHGMSMYVRKTGPYADESYAAGELLLEYMCAQTGARNRGVHATNAYTGNNWSERPCVLVEMGYMTNPREDELLNDHDYQLKLIDGYVAALEQWNRQYNRLNIVQPECDGVI